MSKLTNIFCLMLTLTIIACKGPNGEPGMEMSSCDISKQKVRQILTGESRDCLGFTSAKMVTADQLHNTYVNSEFGYTVVQFDGDKVHSIQVIELTDGEIFAFGVELVATESQLNSVTELANGSIETSGVVFTIQIESDLFPAELVPESAIQIFTSSEAMQTAFQNKLLELGL